MNCNLQNQIINTYSNDYKFFFSKPNVVGIALGYKYIKGFCTCEPCIHVLVSKKIQRNCLPSNALIPTLHKGIKTDVIETGKFTQKSTPNNSAPGEYTGRIRPIKPGYGMSVASSATFFPFTGTFGYIVIDNEQISKTYCLLSTNKTFADLNDAPIGMDVVQPSVTYGGRAPNDVVAKLLRFTPIKFIETLPNNLQDFNTIDASVASYTNIGEIQLIDPFIQNLGIPLSVLPPVLNTQAQWNGCKLGKRTGPIVSISSIIQLTYEDFKQAWFRDVFLVKGITNAQDFGALACDKDLHALGLVFGISINNYVCTCKISNIEDLLKVTLLTSTT